MAAIKSSWVLLLVLSLFVSHMATAIVEESDTDASTDLAHNHRHHKKTKPPAHAPVKAPVHAPVKAPAHAPVKAPVCAPVNAPVHAPVKAPAHAPVYSPPKTPSVQPPISGPPGCAGMCMRYCKTKALPKRPCMRACGACCNFWLCVPSGPTKCPNWTSVIENGKPFACP